MRFRDFCDKLYAFVGNKEKRGVYCEELISHIVKERSDSYSELTSTHVNQARDLLDELNVDNYRDLSYERRYFTKIAPIIAPALDPARFEMFIMPPDRATADAMCKVFFEENMHVTHENVAKKITELFVRLIYEYSGIPFYDNASDFISWDMFDDAEVGSIREHVKEVVPYIDNVTKQLEDINAIPKHDVEVLSHILNRMEFHMYPVLDAWIGHFPGDMAVVRKELRTVAEYVDGEEIYNEKLEGYIRLFINITTEFLELLCDPDIEIYLENRLNPDFDIQCYQEYYEKVAAPKAERYRDLIDSIYGLLQNIAMDNSYNT